MTPETLEALKGSIEKWRKIVEENAADDGGFDCPLCWLFARGKACRDCPVEQSTGFIKCRFSPYEVWATLNKPRGSWRADTPDKLEAARTELAFLRSLLPEGETA